MLQQSVINKASISPHSGPPSFIGWLENRLDDLGLDCCLYARCILQVCHQPLAYIGKDDTHECSASVLIRARSGSDLTRFSEDMSPQMGNSQLKQALCECLSAVGLNKLQTDELVSEIAEHYTEQQFLALKSVPKHNESVDSGVCPSPEGSFQNYDEAFPPLCDEDFPKALINGCDVDDDDMEQLVCRSSLDLPSAPDPVFLPKPNFIQLPPVIDGVFDRQLHSCPTDSFFMGQSDQTATTPQFVVPKCSQATASAKVGSCPTRLEFGYSFGPHPPSSASLPLQPENQDQNVFETPKFVLPIVNNEPMFEPFEMDYNIWGYNQIDVMDTDGTEFCLPRVEDEERKGLNALKNTSFNGALQLPISPDTHFVPIRCEDMNEAFEPPLPESIYAVDYWGQEEYYVLRQPSSMRTTSSCSSRSLALKFKAVRPEKICQTQTGQQEDLVTNEQETKVEWTLDNLITNDEGSDAGSQMGGIWTPLDLLSPLSKNESEVDWPDPKAKVVSLGVGSSLWQPTKSLTNLQQEDWGESELPEICAKNEPPSKELLDAADDEDDMLLSYVGNISLISPLETTN